MSRTDALIPMSTIFSTFAEKTCTDDLTYPMKTTVIIVIVVFTGVKFYQINCSFYVNYTDRRDGTLRKSQPNMRRDGIHLCVPEGRKGGL